MGTFLLGLKAYIGPTVIAAVGGVLIFLFSVVTIQRHYLNLAKERAAAAQGDIQRLNLEVQEERNARAETERRYKVQQGIANEAQRKTEILDLNRRAADAASQRMFKQFDIDLARARAAALNPASAGASSSASDPGLLSPDLYGKLLGRARRLDERAREFGSIADLRAIAGEACVRAYESLNPTSP